MGVNLSTVSGVNKMTHIHSWFHLPAGVVRAHSLNPSNS